MIPEGLETTVGFLIGLMVGTCGGAVLMAALVGGAREDAQQAAFTAGVRYERNRRARAIAQLQRTDLAGDEATELGIIEA